MTIRCEIHARGAAWLALALAVTCLAASPVRANFADVGQSLGVVVNNNGVLREDWGFGAAFNDFDGDGDLDLYVATHTGAPNMLYRQEPGGGFVDVAAAAGVDDLGDGRAVKFADYDNDGDDDFFLGNFEGPNRLFRNNGNGTFTDVADSAIAAGNLTFGACWADYDNDGYVDLYVVNRRRGTAVAGINQLFHNQGDGTFVDRAAALGVDDERAGLEAVWFDFDNDRDADLYLSNDRYGGNRLWRNDGAGGFVDVSAASGTNLTINSMGVDVGDYDNNGYLDLYVTNSNEFGSIFNALLRNNGDGTFDNVAAELGVRGTRWGWGCAFLDADNDSDLDIYVVNASAISPLEGTNQLFWNIGVGPFNESGAGNGVDDSGEGYGLCVGDFDDNGSLDMFVSNNKSPSVLYRNTGAVGRWLKVRTIGTESNRSGIGARVRVVAGPYDQIREISGGSSYLSQHCMDAHFGLGLRDSADVVEVLWPSGIVDRLEGVAAGQTLTIVEGNTGVEEKTPSPTFLLEQNYPNPFNPGTTIEFTLSAGGPAKLTIHDAAGRLVATLVNDDLDPGPHEYHWNGVRGDGSGAASGVYFYRLETSNGVLMRKMVRVK